MLGQVMVEILASKAEGSFLGRGTHVWLVISSTGSNNEEVKTTFSGSKAGKLLRVIKDFKRDYDRHAERGRLEIPCPNGMDESEWVKRVCAAGEEIMTELDNKYVFSGIWPYGESRNREHRGKLRGNCATILRMIVEKAGGEIPKGKLKGFIPGLR